jgi:hypothetical protein
MDVQDYYNAIRLQLEYLHNPPKAFAILRKVRNM